MASSLCSISVVAGVAAYWCMLFSTNKIKHLTGSVKGVAIYTVCGERPQKYTQPGTFQGCFPEAWPWTGCSRWCIVQEGSFHWYGSWLWQSLSHYWATVHNTYNSKGQRFNFTYSIREFSPQFPLSKAGTSWGKRSRVGNSNRKKGVRKHV